MTTVGAYCTMNELPGQLEGGDWLIFVVGPTASGKSALAIELARRYAADILSCDALCFYRGMDIGTAKVPEAERGGIAHHGMDLVPVSEVFSVERYQRYVEGLLAARRGQRMVVVGGSGLYLKSFFESVTDGIEVSPEIREEVAHLKATRGLAGLLTELKAVSGGSAGLGNLDVWNMRRVEKALERCLETGRPHVELEAAFRARGAPYPQWRKLVVEVTRPREVLKARSAERVRAMLQAGLVDEVARLRAEGLERNVTARKAIGYRETLAHLDGAMDLEALEAAICVNTNKLIRKQATWFRNQMQGAGDIVRKVALS